EKGTRFYDDICFEALVDTIAHELAHAIVGTFEFKYEGEEGGGHGKLFYDICKEIEEMQKRDILGSEEIGNLASQLAVVKELRTIILHCQRLLVQNKGWVVVGRDITSEHQGKINREQVEKDLLARDEKDKNRTLSPLRKTADRQGVSSNVLAEIEDIVE
ncbi:3380_t:CDS:2, partial [Cetraspora pellucida]